MVFYFQHRAALSGEFVTALGIYRKKIFVDRLKWDLEVQRGMEFDQYDRDDTIYVVALDTQGQIVGCARLLPTTSNYLLGDRFSQLMQGQPLPNAPDVWELSRFSAAHPERTGLRREHLSSELAVQLMHACLAFAASRGIRKLIAVTQLGSERLLRRAGFQAYRAGAPMVLRGHAVAACWVSCNDIGPALAMGRLEPEIEIEQAVMQPQMVSTTATASSTAPAADSARAWRRDLV